MSNHYAEAIIVLRKLSMLDQDSLVDIIDRIAVTNPSALVKAYNHLHPFNQVKTNPGYLTKMDHLFAVEGRNAKIRLIKMYREATRVGLGDAKNFVEERYNIGVY